MTKPKWRRVLGQVCQSIDGVIWKWTLDGVSYDWCPAGQCRCINVDEARTRIVLWSPRLEGAVAYTMGYHDGTKQADRSNLPQQP